MQAEFPGAGSWTDAVFNADFSAYYKLVGDLTKPVNDDDSDGDGIPDFADGFDLESGNSADNLSTNDFFTKWKIYLGPYADVTQAQMRITYSASEPTGVTHTASLYTSAPGQLRIWTKNGFQARNKASVSANPAGHYVPPGTHRAADLGFSASKRIVDMYIEAVNPTIDEITLEVDPDGTTGPKDFVCLDRMNTTALNVQIAMDANRDLAIDFNDPADTKGTNVFWLNDNYDVKHWSGKGTRWTLESPDGWEEDDDKSVYGQKNCEDDRIGRRGPHWGSPSPSEDNCLRDLEDFTVVQLRVPGVISNLTGITYWLGFNNFTGNPSVNLFKAITNGVTGPFDYLTNSLVASNQVLETRAYTISTAYEPISADDINRYDQPIGFLLEGKTAGKGDFTFVIMKDSAELCRSSISLDLQPITNFFDKFWVEEPTNTYRSRILGLIPWTTRRADKWRVEVATNAQQVQATTAYVPVSTQYLLYVNGWNVSPEQKTNDFETAYKRLWWQGYRGGFGVFDWPTLYGIEGAMQMIRSERSRMNYDDSEMIAWLSATALANLMQDLNTSGDLRVWAHSMGNAVMGEAIRKYDAISHPQLKAYVASQAAIGASFYSQQTDPQEDFGSSGPETPNIMAYWSSGTNNGAQPYLYSNATKVVKMCNYYNPDDYALHKWELNNAWKPDDSVGWGYAYGGKTEFYDESVYKTNRFCRWGDMTQPNIEGLEITNGVPDLRERYEVFSYCAESRLKALGEGSNSAFAGTNMNLRLAPFNYDDYHYSHSKQFRSNIDDQWPYYYYLKNDCGF